MPGDQEIIKKQKTVSARGHVKYLRVHGLFYEIIIYGYR